MRRIESRRKNRGEQFSPLVAVEEDRDATANQSKRMAGGSAQWAPQLVVALFVTGALIVAAAAMIMTGLALEAGSLSSRKTTTPRATSTLTVPPTATEDKQPTATQAIDPTPTQSQQPTSTPTQDITTTATLTPTVEATPTPTIVVTGWLGAYYDNDDLTGEPLLVRDDAVIAFEWDYGAPAEGLPADGFSVRWTRSMHFVEGLYRFHATVDDGMRLYVDGELILDEWKDGAQRESMADLGLARGNHTVEVDYYDRGGAAMVQVWWERIADAREWNGEYWANLDLSGTPCWCATSGRWISIGASPARAKRSPTIIFLLAGGAWRTWSGAPIAFPSWWTTECACGSTISWSSMPGATTAGSS